ncbi:MAG: hypothetical protein AAGK04_05905 [Planctomycetota bacterium]
MRDDRGEHVRGPGMTAWFKLSERLDPDLTNAFSQSRFALPFGFDDLLLVASAALFVISVPLLVLGLVASHWLFAGAMWMMVIGVIVGALLSLFQRFLARRGRVVAAKQLGYCGQCLYPIYEVQAHGDGCTVCPECGAAWKLESHDAR